jgi:hypothetical protein
MAYTLIGGTAVGAVLILLFPSAPYAGWFRIKPTADDVLDVVGSRGCATASTSKAVGIPPRQSSGPYQAQMVRVR